MENVIGELIESLRTGFVDKTYPHLRKDYLPELIINDKAAGKKVLTTIERELRNCDEFWFSVAFVTTGGVTALINLLQELKQKNIKGKLLVSQYQNFTQPEALKTLLKFDNIELKILVSGAFHAKGYLFKKGSFYNLIIGSSNLTDRALSSNKEWNLKISTTDHSNLIFATLHEFQNEFDIASKVTLGFITEYEKIYKAQQKFLTTQKSTLEFLENKIPEPNRMQIEALENLSKLRGLNKKKALIISATGTGKTYLSAFDVKSVNPKKFLFVVHRNNIALSALNTFKKVFGKSRSMSLYESTNQELEADFIFTTIQTLSRENHLFKFTESHFDYIVIDETHHAGAETYQKILKHFKPKFLLGMTATPERTDGFDIFNEFDYNIAYEIRLQKALEEEMLCPFHYFGVSDLSVNENELKKEGGFNLLTSTERVDKVLEKASFYGCDDGTVRGLIFCSTTKEIHALSKEFNLRGLRTIALDGESSPESRSLAIDRIESDDETIRLDYIFTVNIFGEGIDIPRINQVILLRPTQSAIVFVQQLGRGLRKYPNKDYLTVIDFISNYSNNYLIPIALYGDTTFNKDKLRKLMSSGSSLIPGASTINFDSISQKKIFQAIDKATMTLRKDLTEDYKLLKFRLGKIPMMMDFLEQGSRDPYLYVESSFKSYFNFVSYFEDSYKAKLSKHQILLIELFSKNIGNGKRVEEIIILRELLENESLTTKKLKKIIFDNYAYHITSETISSCLRNINFDFISKPEKIITLNDSTLKFEKVFSSLLENQIFKDFLIDLLNYGWAVFNKNFDEGVFINGFILYNKYSRRDVCRILNWEKNEDSTMYGYKIKNKTAPLFVTYHKKSEIPDSTKYEDKFISNSIFQWYTRPGKRIESPDVQAILNYKNGLRIPLFIMKSNDEGVDFYYMGEVTPIEKSFEVQSLKNSKGSNVSVVKIDFAMDFPVQDSIYEYITSFDD